MFLYSLKLKTKLSIDKAPELMYSVSNESIKRGEEEMSKNYQFLREDLILVDDLSQKFPTYHICIENPMQTNFRKKSYFSISERKEIDNPKVFTHTDYPNYYGEGTLHGHRKVVSTNLRLVLNHYIGRTVEEMGKEGWVFEKFCEEQPWHSYLEDPIKKIRKHHEELYYKVFDSVVDYSSIKEFVSLLNSYFKEQFKDYGAFKERLKALEDAQNEKSRKLGKIKDSYDDFVQG